MSVSPYALSVCQRFCAGGVTNEGAACASVSGAGKVCQNNPSIACADDADCHNTPCVAAKGTCVGGSLGSRSCLTSTDCLSCSPDALGQISDQLQSAGNVFDELTQRGAAAACSACRDAECPKGNSNVPCWVAIGVGVLVILVLVLVVVVSRRRGGASGATTGAEELFSDLTSVGSGLTEASGMSALTAM